MSLLKKRATKTKNIKKFRNKKFNLNNFVEEYYMEQNTAYITVKVDNYNDIVSEQFEYILDSIDNVIQKKEEMDINLIDEYNERMMSVMPMKKVYLTISEIFAEVVDRLKI